MYLGHGSNNEAELIGLFYGLQYCKDLFIRRVEVELDSLLVVHWLEKGRCGIWYLEDYWEKIQSMLATLEFKVKHTYREGNAGADFLARMASDQKNGTWNSYHEVPHLLKGILKVDKLGIPAIRL
ncbi:uncharacterized protein LOC122290907 [Carya illinoinensis]|uniref:uncharacterized protein LOC122290907 n=1 Tax=Carya illinoinensis TaxID=32201 RepID=UPI001C7185BC|nr:uncharacterized protein LOC122290907 [Carya illinoinensis]